MDVRPSCSGDVVAFLVHRAEGRGLIRLFFRKTLESSVIISWEIHGSVYLQRKEKTKWTS